MPLKAVCLLCRLLPVLVFETLLRWFMSLLSFFLHWIYVLGLAAHFQVVVFVSVNIYISNKALTHHCCRLVHKTTPLIEETVGNQFWSCSWHDRHHLVSQCEVRFLNVKSDFRFILRIMNWNCLPMGIQKYLELFLRNFKFFGAHKGWFIYKAN